MKPSWAAQMVMDLAGVNPELAEEIVARIDVATLVDWDAIDPETLELVIEDQLMEFIA